MNIEEFRFYCLSKKGVTECFPFDETTLVFKVMDKMFALTDVNRPLRITLKVDPEEAVEFRERYPAVNPAYHMNKIHWIMIDIDGSVDNNTLKTWIDRSYDIILSGLPKKKKLELNNL